MDVGPFVIPHAQTPKLIEQANVRSRTHRHRPNPLPWAVRRIASHGTVDALSGAPLLQRGNRVAPIDRRNDGQLKSRDAFEADCVVLAFNGRGRRRKCELLPDNFAATANCDCSEYEFLRA